MSDHVAFLRAIAADPADDTARLAYADFLEEAGDPAQVARAEFVRTQVLAHTLHPNDPRRGELDARAAALFSEHWVGWWAALCAAVGLPPPLAPPAGFRLLVRRFLARPQLAPGHPYQITGGTTVGRVMPRPPTVPDTLREVAFDRGFPQSVSFLGQLAEVRVVIRRWADVSPLEGLDLRGTVARDWRAIDGEHLRGVRVLKLEQAAAPTVTAAGASKHLPRIEELHLKPDRSNVLRPVEQYRAFARSPLAERVRRLRVVIGGGTEAAALDGPHLATLRGLHIEVVYVTGEPLEDIRAGRAVAALLGSPHLTGLRELTLVGAPGAAALAGLPPRTAAGLVRLDLNTGPVWGEVALLLQADAFPAVADLALSANEAAGLATALAESPLVGRLRHLKLTGGMPVREIPTVFPRLASALDPDRLETLAVGRQVREVPEVWNDLRGRFPGRVSVV